MRIRTWMLIIAYWLCVAGSRAATGASDATVTLEIGCTLESSPMKLKCVLHNGTAKPFETSPIATNDSRLYIITPDGQRLPWFHSKHVRPVIVAVGATEEWELPLGDLFGLLKLDKAGVYTIVWEIGNLRSNQASVYVPKH